MLKNRLAMQNADGASSEREMMRIPHDINIWKRREVQIQKAGVSAQRTAADRNSGTSGFRDGDIECPTSPATPGWINFAEPTREGSRAAVLMREPLDTRHFTTDRLRPPNGWAFSGAPSERSERPERSEGRRVRCNAMLGGPQISSDGCDRHPVRTRGGHPQPPADHEPVYFPPNGDRPAWTASGDVTVIENGC